jgi:hypothetical protein
LGQGTAAGRHVDDWAGRATQQYIRQGATQYIGTHDHTCAPAGWGVINIAMLALAIGAKIMGVQLPLVVF